MELLPAIVGLAVVDSINPSALLATIVLLLRGRPARPLVAVYVAAILVTYFAVGLALTLGLGLTPRALLAAHVALGDRAGALLERLRTRLGAATREGLLWLLGLVGFLLLADALGHFRVIG